MSQSSKKRKITTPKRKLKPEQSSNRSKTPKIIITEHSKYQEYQDKKEQKQQQKVQKQQEQKEQKLQKARKMKNQESNKT